MVYIYIYIISSSIRDDNINGINGNIKECPIYEFDSNVQSKYFIDIGNI